MTTIRPHGHAPSHGREPRSAPPTGPAAATNAPIPQPAIPDAAVEAAAQAMEDAAMALLGRDLGTIHRDTLARAAITAALPLLSVPGAAEVARLREAVDELTEAIRLTVEYTGNDTLPPIEGWSWFDALTKHTPDVAAAFARNPIRFPPARTPDDDAEGKS